MCIIAYKTRGAELLDDQIKYMYARNPHGAGYMYENNGVIHYKKGFFKVEDFIEDFRAHVSKDMVAALHFRIRTHGEICASLCHPFPLDGDMYQAEGDSEFIMMHNGIIPDASFKAYEQRGDSDTTAYGRKLSKVLNKKLPDGKAKQRIQHEIGASRLLIMDKDGNTELIGDWYNDDGIYYSNVGYLSKADIEIRKKASSFNFGSYYDYYSKADLPTKTAPIIKIKGDTYTPIEDSYILAYNGQTVVYKDLQYYVGPRFIIYWKEENEATLNRSYTLGFDADAYATDYGLDMVTGDFLGFENDISNYFIDINANEVYTLTEELEFECCDETTTEKIQEAYNALFTEDDEEDKDQLHFDFY